MGTDQCTYAEIDPSVEQSAWYVDCFFFLENKTEGFDVDHVTVKVSARQLQFRGEALVKLKLKIHYFVYKSGY